jgi:hypothetical protein
MSDMFLALHFWEDLSMLSLANCFMPHLVLRYLYQLLSLLSSTISSFVRVMWVEERPSQEHTRFLPAGTRRQQYVSNHTTNSGYAGLPDRS